MNAVFDTVEDNIQRKVASDVMKAASLNLAIDTRVESEGDCTGAGRQWRQVGPDSRCLHLMRESDGWVEVEDDIYDNMKKYGLDDIDKFYGALLNCAENGGDDKEVDTGSMVSGEVPTCFFNVPVVTVKNPDCDAADLFNNDCRPVADPYNG